MTRTLLRKNFRISSSVRTLASVLLLTFASYAQSERPSPLAQARCSFADGKAVTVAYSSPRMKGRQVFGGLVPYDKVWRTGANEATTLESDVNLVIEANKVPAGKYTIFTVPNPSKWTLIVNKKTGEWGIPYTYQADELVRADLAVVPIPSPIENFTIRFDQVRGGCVLRFRWENTDASGLVVEDK